MNLAGHLDLSQSLFISEKLPAIYILTETRWQAHLNSHSPTNHNLSNDEFLSTPPPFQNPFPLYTPTHPLHLRPTPPPRSLLDIRPIIKRVPTQRTRTLITARKPLEQTAAMEEVLASLTALIRHLLVARHDAVADSAFGLAL